MAAREVVVKKYVVRLSAAERAWLEALLDKGKSPAQRLTKASKGSRKAPIMTRPRERSFSPAPEAGLPVR